MAKRPSVLKKLSRRILRGSRTRKGTVPASTSAPANAEGEAGHWRAPAWTRAVQPEPGTVTSPASDAAQPVTAVLTRAELARALRRAAQDAFQNGEEVTRASVSALLEGLAKLVESVEEPEAPP